VTGCLSCDETPAFDFAFICEYATADYVDGESMGQKSCPGRA
jgi:hypothetical protein